MHVTSDYYRSRVHRIAAYNLGAPGSCHASASLAKSGEQTRGLSRPLRPSRKTLQLLAIRYKYENHKIA